MIGVTKAEAGACRNKSKNMASDEEQILEKGDEKFLEAVREGDSEAVSALIREGQKVNVGDEGQESSIHKAILGITERARKAPSLEDQQAIVKDLSMLEILVQNGAFIDYLDKNGKRPINVCFDAQHLGVPACAFLLNLKDSSGARIVDLQTTCKLTNQNEGNTLLHDVCWAGNAKCAELLLATNEFTDIDARNKQGKTALHLASFRSSKEVVKVLTGAGADHTAVENNGRRLSKETPEDMALGMGREDTAAYLKSLGATVNAVKAVGRFKKGIKDTDAPAVPA